MPKGRLVLHTKYIDEVGGITEMKVYQVPRTPSTPRGYKYSLAYVFNGQRLVGYDNHERKGDHRHHGDETVPYVFTSLETLVKDFLADAAAMRKELRK